MNMAGTLALGLCQPKKTKCGALFDGALHHLIDTLRLTIGKVLLWLTHCRFVENIGHSFKFKEVCEFLD